MVPFSRNKDLVGRDSVFVQITQLLQALDHRPVVLTGLGGIGKSQVAVEYTYRFADQSPAALVFWANAQSKTHLEQSFREIARAVHIPGWDDILVDVMQLLPEWLSSIRGHWLLVIDNLDDIELLGKPSAITSSSPAWPVLFNCPQGHIIITSRNQGIARSLTAKVIILEPLSILEGSRLMKQTGEIGDNEQISELLKALGCLPLAIAQASAFMARNSVTVSQYFALFNGSVSNRVELLSEDIGDSRRDRSLPNSVIDTVMISLLQMKKLSPRALDLLSFMSLLDRQNIPAYLVSLLIRNDNGFDEAMGYLQAYSLVQANIDRHSFSIDLLVQAATRQWLQSKGSLTKWMEKSVELMYTAFPSGDFANWTKCAELLPHAEVVLQYRLQDSFHQVERAAILHRVGEYEMLQGRYKPAANRIEGAITIRTKILGPEHPDTLASRSNLALVSNSLGKYEEAEQIHWQTLQLEKKVLGEEHPDTLMSINNLALVLSCQGKYEEAEQMHRQTLHAMEKMLGKEHPNTLTSMNNLAAVLESQGKYYEAEQMHWQTLQLKKRVLGEEHPDTLMSTNNLASVLSSQGKYEEAEQMHRQTLHAMEKVLGKEHPNTITSMNNLAEVLQSQGKYNEAEWMNRETLQLREKVLGTNHPNALVSMDNLAIVLYNQGKSVEGKVMQQQALELKKEVLGHEHPDTLTSMNNLAMMFGNQNKGGWR